MRSRVSPKTHQFLHSKSGAARASESRERARLRSQDTRLWWVMIGLGVLVIALYWLER